MLKIIKKLLSQYAKAMFSKSTPLVITPIIGFFRKKMQSYINLSGDCSLYCDGWYVMMNIECNESCLSSI